MTTKREKCPLCRVQMAESSLAHVAGGGLRAGVRSFRCPRCTGFLVHDDARTPLADLGDEEREELSQDARTRAAVAEPPLEITRNVIALLGWEARVLCAICGHAILLHLETEHSDRSATIETIGRRGAGVVPGRCAETGCSCEGGPKALSRKA